MSPQDLRQYMLFFGVRPPETGGHFWHLDTDRHHHFYEAEQLLPECLRGARL